MKLLMLTTWEECCGIAWYAAHLVAALRRAGVDVEIHPIGREGQSFLTADERRRHFDRFLARAAGADAVHVQHEFGFFGLTWREQLMTSSRVLGALARRGKPAFVTFHTVPREARGDAGAHDARARLHRAKVRWQWKRFVARHFREGAALRAVIHGPLARRVLHESGVPLAQIDVVPHGVHLLSTHVERSAARHALGYDDASFVVVLSGFLSSYKGPDIAVAAQRLLARESRDFALALVGGPHPHAAGDDGFGALVAKAGATAATRVTGFVTADEMTRYQAAADLVIAPYREVGLLSSAALAAALGAGKAVVASRIEAFREIAHYHDCLALVPPDSPGALALRIAELRRRPDERAALAARAGAYAQAHTWDRVAALQRALYAGERGMPLAPLAALAD
jgi:glycosyltransferase involved in cell wall biosynthesis